MKEHFKIKAIVIPVDFSETSMLAIEHGGFMAKMTKADLHLLHIQEKNWAQFSVIEAPVIIPTITEMNSKANAKLQEIAEKVKKEYGVVAITAITEGNICDEVTNYADENNADIIVMGTHGVSGFEEFFVGSNTYKVVTRSKCPVLSVQTHAKRLGFGQIVFPIDNSDHTLQKVEHAVELAKAYNSKIHILGLIHTADSEEEHKVISILTSKLEKHLAKHDILHTSSISKTSNFAKATLAYAEKENADLILIMTDQDEESTGLFLGAYAQQIVNHSKTPIFSITPKEGYYGPTNTGGATGV